MVVWQRTAPIRHQIKSNQPLDFFILFYYRCAVSRARCGSGGDVGVVVSKVVSWRWVGGDDGRRLGWCRLWDGGYGDGDEGGVNDGEEIMMVAEMKVIPEQDKIPSSVRLDFRARLNGGRMYSGHLEAK
ncbi:hypothetical protein Tco_0874784 [Tanacetum coccineum]|uniref:Uncharacterized protein n=1 Tax=Tanacetum coccineum TaxID=301880 RepID=A0ABQ5BQL3_9ASTR